MENSINISITPFQAILALAFQLWMIIFPIMIIQRLNHMTRLFEEFLDNGQEQEEQTEH